MSIIDGATLQPDGPVPIKPSIGALQDEIYGLEQLLAEFGAINVIDPLQENLTRLRLMTLQNEMHLPDALEQRLATLEYILKNTWISISDRD